MSTVGAPAGAGPGGKFYGCPLAARWLPRVLAACLLAAGMIVARHLELHQGASQGKQALVVLSAGMVGLWVLRAGAELGLRVQVGSDGVLLQHGTRSQGVQFDRIQRLEFDWPLAASRKLWPALLVVEERGPSWRLPALIQDGPELVRELVHRSGRSDLQAWCDSLGLDRRMALGPACVIVGYLLSVALLLAAIVFYLR